MAQQFTAVNLSQLPPPQVVESLSYEDILAECVAWMRANSDGTGYDAYLESDPGMKVIEVYAYREMLVRQRINDAARSVMLAYAKGSDLDQIGANVGLTRFIIQEEDPTTIPPTPEIEESDDDFRARIQLAPEGYTTAGSEGSYIFHAKNADGKVKDVQPVSPTPGSVVVYILSRDGDGKAGEALLNKVRAALTPKDVRPMTDKVTVLSANIVPYTIDAELSIYDGPDPEVVLANSIAAMKAYAEEQRKIGYDVTLSGIYAALHQAGVQKVTLKAPTADVVIDEGEAAYMTAINVVQGASYV